MVRAHRHEVSRQDDDGLIARVRRGWGGLAERIVWTPPTRAEIAAVGRAGLAAALAWLLAKAVTDIEAPVLAPLAALITVRVSVHSSIRSAIERSAAVVLGVLVAVAIGNTLGLNALTVGLLTSASLAFALLVLRLPRPAATQVPVSALVVMAALAAGEQSYAWERAFDTVLGAAVGVAVSLALPASRVDDARGSMRRLATVLGEELDTMGGGLEETWSTRETAEWRHTARLTRQRLVEQMTEAVGQGREGAHWNLRDRCAHRRPPPIRGGDAAAGADRDRGVGDRSGARGPRPADGWRASADGGDGVAPGLAREPGPGLHGRGPRRAVRRRDGSRLAGGVRAAGTLRPGGAPPDAGASHDSAVDHRASGGSSG